MLKETLALNIEEKQVENVQKMDIEEKVEVVNKMNEQPLEDMDEK